MCDQVPIVKYYFLSSLRDFEDVDWYVFVCWAKAPGCILASVRDLNVVDMAQSVAAGQFDAMTEGQRPQQPPRWIGPAIVLVFAPAM
jgi:hypothetical protein